MSQLATTSPRRVELLRLNDDGQLGSTHVIKMKV